MLARAFPRLLLVSIFLFSGCDDGSAGSTDGDIDATSRSPMTQPNDMVDAMMTGGTQGLIPIGGTMLQVDSGVTPVDSAVLDAPTPDAAMMPPPDAMVVPVDMQMPNMLPPRNCENEDTQQLPITAVSGASEAGGMNAVGGMAAGGMPAGGGAPSSGGAPEGGAMAVGATPSGPTTGPSSRIFNLSVPENVDVARRAGCSVVGRNMGTGLNSLLNTFMVDLNDELMPDANGRFQTMLLMELADWAAGQTGNMNQLSQLKFYSGTESAEGEILVERSSFQNDDPTQDVVVSFEADTRCRRVETARGDFSLALDVSDGNQVRLRLRQTQLRGDLSVAAEGFSLSNGHIGGYLTRDSVIELLEDLRAICSGQNAPSFCGIARAFLDSPDLVVSFLLGNYDSFVGPDGMIDGECQGMPCNAVSVCLLVSSVAIKIDGVEGD